MHHWVSLLAEGEAGRRVKLLSTCCSCDGGAVWPIGGRGVHPLQRALHLHLGKGISLTFLALLHLFSVSTCHDTVGSGAGAGYRGASWAVQCLLTSAGRSSIALDACSIVLVALAPHAILTNTTVKTILGPSIASSIVLGSWIWSFIVLDATLPWTAVLDSLLACLALAWCVEWKQLVGLRSFNLYFTNCTNIVLLWRGVCRRPFVTIKIIPIITLL